TRSALTPGRIIDVRMAPFDDGICVAIDDVTAREEAERRLDESEERLRIAIDAVGLGAYEIDLTTGAGVWSASAFRLLGLEPPADLVGSFERWRGALHPDDRAHVEAAHDSALRERRSWRVEYRVIADGALRWLETFGRFIEGESGRVRSIGVAIDITERKLAEEKLGESEQRYRTLFDAIDEGFCIIEFVDGPHGPLSDYVHVEANAAYATHAGIPDVVGQYVREMVGAEAQGWIDLYGGVLRTGEPIRFERELEATGRWLELAAFRIEPASRRQVAVLFQDQTEKRRAQAALRDLAETLEQRVVEEMRERVRAEEALRQSQKMESIGQLTGGIAHDFNNLLAAIGGSFSLIQRRLADGKPGVERYISAGQDAVRRAASLTQRLLAFSRRQTLDPKPTDVNRLIAGMEELIRRTVGPDVEVEVVGAAGLWATKVDAPQLESVLLNLCINGRDAMAPDGGRLTIETANKWLDDRGARARDLKPGQYISLCVTDTGTGMTPDVIERAFDPFFTTKPIGQGTGLGLSMVYGFVRQSGGQVRIYSELGKGTTMCLYLPRHADKVEDAPEIAHEAGPERGHGETVLVIDDEPSLRMMIVDVLEETGYVVLQAGAGAEGLRYLETARKIDLLVTDVGLPGGMNGRQVADAARMRRPDLKVLFITGYAENAVLGNGDLAPGMEIVTKPFVVTDFAAKVRDILDH
ncbi:MAG TPA: ATP-binding protein, partial [Verrucomicrobiae bacterium]|nr:ATP-binding protein [Verrucomicrobiae bacterium]